MKNDEPRLAPIVRAWWTALQSEGQRADRAALARCTNLVEVRFEPSWHALVRAAEGAGMDVGRARRLSLAIVAAVVSHVRMDRPNTAVAGAMGAGTKPAVSDLRFRRLLATTDPEDLRRGLVRAVHLLERTADVGALAEAIFYWGDPVRLRWAEDYYRSVTA